MSKICINEADQVAFSQLIADDLENGALEKVTDLFRYNKTLYLIVGNLLRDEHMKVRLGANILMDELRVEKPDEVKLALPGILPLLQDQNPTVRGDAADMLGMIGSVEHIDLLQKLLKDSNHQVAEIAAEAIDCIKETNLPQSS
ncbi:MAG: HEAT repeat domain-containing protein [SAR324 cluster bacterium]|nr:HEAT repeat domain-containing protein [SAR324 cluster bacterium]